MSSFKMATHKFSEVPKIAIERSKFNRPSSHITTLNSGYLVPIYCDEMLPGDTFQIDASFFARQTTSIVPVMDNAYLDIHFFACPKRVLWKNWKKFNGERLNPNDSIDYTVPQVTLPYVSSMTISNYIGIPTATPSGVKVDAWWHRMYNKTFAEWYRDQNLQDSPVIEDGDTDNIANYTLLKRNKRHDYFTSCLPWPQKGDSVNMPLGVSAPVMGNGKTLGMTDGTNNFSHYYASGSGMAQSFYNQNVGASLSPTGVPTNNKGLGVTTDATKSGLIADLTQATVASVNALRLAIQLQRILEKDARSGTRYTESNQARFGVTSPDSRLQRPEYLGGCTSSLRQSLVAQTSSTDSTSPQANLSAYGTFSNNCKITFSATEHMVIMGIASIRTDMKYQRGINRMFSRRTRYDYYHPELAHIGEQAVLNKEIFVQGTSEDDDVFGYQEAWAEYRYKPSLVTGKMCSQDPQSLDMWHYAQKFTALPRLNDSFIEENPAFGRSVAVTNEPEFYLDCYFNETSTRPMPLYSVPGMADHF